MVMFAAMAESLTERVTGLFIAFRNSKDNFISSTDIADGFRVETEKVGRILRRAKCLMKQGKGVDTQYSAEMPDAAKCGGCELRDKCQARVEVTTPSPPRNV